MYITISKLNFFLDNRGCIRVGFDTVRVLLSNGQKQNPYNFDILLLALDRWNSKGKCRVFYEPLYNGIDKIKFSGLHTCNQEIKKCNAHTCVGSLDRY